MDKNTIIAVVIGVVFLSGAGYFLFIKPATSPSPTGVDTSAPTSAEELIFVNLAAQLEPLGFDLSILSDPRFTALRDLHTPIFLEPAGRRDPFAPLGR